MKKLESVRNPDITNKTQKYWDKILASYDLAMMEGLNMDHLTYAGTTADLAIIEENSQKGGKTKPFGHGPQ